MKNIYIDCSFISTTKLNTGIQRVVRKVIENIFDITEGTDYKPVLVVLENSDIIEISKDYQKIEKVIPKEDDILLLIDSTWHLNTWDSVIFAKSNRVKVIAVIYDIIPLSHPQFCDATLVGFFTRWFDSALKYVDGFITISKTVQDSLYSYLSTKYPLEVKGKKFDYFWLGADFKYKNSILPTTSIKSELKELYQNSKNVYLIVSTVEPRKNHKYLLDVFDRLWQENIDVSLNIVGKIGWKVEDLLQRIQSHPQLNKRLFFWKNLDDDELRFCYKNSKMLLFPSYIEGFGLPIIESLSNSLPVLASDTPIHKEIGGDKIGYFDINSTDSLYSKIKTIEEEGVPDNLRVDKEFKWLSWHESTQMLFEKLDMMQKDIVIDLEEIEKQKKNTMESKSVPNISKMEDEKRFSLKESIKSIPIIGWLGRFVYNIIRINNLKHRAFITQNMVENLIEREKNHLKKIDRLELKIEKQNRLIKEGLDRFTQEQYRHIKAIKEEQNQSIKDRIDRFEEKQKHLLKDRIDRFEEKQNRIMRENIEKRLKEYLDSVDKNMFYQSLSMHQRVDQFIFDAKIDLKNKNIPLEDIKESSKIFLDDYYLAFENQFRGSRDKILQRYEGYFDFITLEDIKKSLDIGCGRGEWVELLQKHGVDACGVDINYAMIKKAQDFGIDNLTYSDVFPYLRDTKDSSYDLITAFHIVEHIPFEKLLSLIGEIKRVLKDGGKVLIETPNPENLLVSTFTFYKDPTHLNPLPSEVVRFMFEYMGFEDIKTYPLHPFPKDMHIKEETKSAKLLNSMLYKEQDYIVVAQNRK